MFFDFEQPKQQQKLKCPYCGAVVAAPLPGSRKHNVMVVKRGLFFPNGDMEISCSLCRAPLSIVIRY